MKAFLSKHRTANGWFSTLLFLILFYPPLTQSAPVVDIGVDNGSQNLALHMMAFDDTHEPIETLQQALDHAGWEPIRDHPAILKTPREHSSLWLKARVVNSATAPQSHWLELSPWRLDIIEVWLLDPASNEVLDHFRTGLDTPVANRRIQSTRPLIPLTLQPGQSVELIANIQSDSRPYLSITDWDPLAFSKQSSNRFQLHSMALAAVLTLLFVLILKFDIRYALLGFWLLSAFVLQSEKEGYISYLFFNSLSHHALNIRASSAILEQFFFLISSAHLLDLRRNRLTRSIVLTATSTVMIAIPAIILLEKNHLRDLFIIIQTVFIFGWLLLIPSALRRTVKWQKPILLLLSTNYATLTSFVVNYVFNRNHTADFSYVKICIATTVILGLIAIYTRQKKDHEKHLEDQIFHQKQQERERLERAVIERTQALNRALETSKEASRSKTAFLARVTHDLKSPLTSIMGYSQLLSIQPGQTGQMSHSIHTSAQHMLNMVSRLIDYAHDVTNTAVKRNEIYLHGFLDGIHQEANILAAKNLNRFDAQLQPSLPPVIVSDETCIRAILINLIDNACKHTVDGDIRLAVEHAEGESMAEKRLIMTVVDTGCGIPADKQAQLFTPLYRGSQDSEGSGLGLAIVDELAHKLRGTVTLTSEVGLGTRVRVELPVRLGKETSDTAIIKLPTSMLPRFDAEGRMAWVVEDAPDISKLLTMELEHLGFIVHQFTHAEEAIAAFREVTPDLILTDHWLPQASGDAVLRAAQKHCPTLPVILLSATWRMSSPITSPDGIEYTARLSKPVNLAHLRHAIAHACRIELDTSERKASTDEGASEVEALTVSPTTMAQLREWLELGAVTDFIEWSDQLLERSPEHAGLAHEIRLLAQRGDFSTLAQRLERLAPTSPREREQQ